MSVNFMFFNAPYNNANMYGNNQYFNAASFGFGLGFGLGLASLFMGMFSQNNFMQNNNFYPGLNLNTSSRRHSHQVSAGARTASTVPPTVTRSQEATASVGRSSSTTSTADHTQCEADKAELEKRLAAASAEARRLQGLLDAAKLAAEGANTNVTRLTEQLGDKTRELTEALARLSGEEGGNADARATIETLRNEKNEIESQLQEARALAGNKDEDYAEALARIEENANERIATAEARAVLAEEQALAKAEALKDAERELASAWAEARTAGSTASANAETIRNLEQKLDEARAAAQAATTDKDLSAEALAEVRRDAERQIAEVRTEARAAIESANMRAESNARSAQEAEQRAVEAEARALLAEQEASAKAKALTDAERALESAQAEARTAGSSASASAETIRSLTEQRAQAKAEANAAIVDSQTATSVLADARATIETLRNEKNEIERQLQEARALAGDKDKDYAEALARIEQNANERIATAETAARLAQQEASSRAEALTNAERELASAQTAAQNAGSTATANAETIRILTEQRAQAKAEAEAAIRDSQITARVLADVQRTKDDEIARLSASLRLAENRNLELQATIDQNQAAVSGNMRFDNNGVQFEITVGQNGVGGQVVITENGKTRTVNLGSIPATKENAILLADITNPRRVTIPAGIGGNDLASALGYTNWTALRTYIQDNSVEANNALYDSKTRDGLLPNVGGTFLLPEGKEAPEGFRKTPEQAVAEYEALIKITYTTYEQAVSGRYLSEAAAKRVYGR